MHYWFKKPQTLLAAPLLLLLALLAACGSTAPAVPTTTPPVGSAPVATTSAQPAPMSTVVATPLPEVMTRSSGETAVKRLKMSVVPPQAQLTVQYLMAQSSGAPLRPMMEFLTRIDPLTGNLTGQLATEWEASNGFQSWRFQLQDGVNFHDGSPFTADDVMFTWELMTSEQALGTQTGFMKKMVDRIEIIDDHELVMHLTQPEVNWPYFWSDDLDMQITSRDYWDKMGAKGYQNSPVGTGPYRFLEFREGVGISYEKVEDHWRKTAPFPELEILYAPEDVTRVSQLLAREVQMATIPRALTNQVTSKGMKIIKSTLPATQVLIALGGQYLDPALRDPNDPLSNKLVRQALNLSLDRNTINQELFGGAGELMTIHTFHPSLTGDAYDPSWQVYPYDPEKAKALLKEAGYSASNPVKFKLMTTKMSGVPELPDLAEAAAIMWRDVEVEAQIEETEFANLRANYTGYKMQNTAWTVRTSATPTFRLFNIFYGSKDKMAGVVHAYEAQWLEDAWQQFSTTTDQDKRRQLLRSIGQQMYDEYAAVPVLYLFAEIAVDPNVIQGYQSHQLIYEGMRNVEDIVPVYK